MPPAAPVDGDPHDPGDDHGGGSGDGSHEVPADDGHSEHGDHGNAHDDKNGKSG